MFLKTATPFSLEFGDSVKSDALGALSTPSMAIQGLSRVMGPVAAQPPTGAETIEKKLASVIANQFDPDEFFKGATILGGIPLSEILAPVASLAGADVPKLLSKQLPDRIEARFDWKTNINGHDSLGLFVPNPNGMQTSLEMHGVVSTPVDPPGPAVFNAEATLLNFKVNLFGFIIIWFDRLRFLAQSGAKPEVAVDLHPGDKTIEFGGPLEFVNTLKDIIPSNGFSDPPSLSVTPSGISAAYSLSIPSVAVGIFALEHVSIGAGFALPFDAKPVEVRFNFCERQRPFSLTVSMLGGGGFFAIAIGTEGVREIEAALEFGAALSIDLGVASGSVEIKAGVYFHWKSKSVELAGYVRLHGELSVLGLISASLTFNLQLAFLKDTGHSVVWGEATLTIEVEVLFFSASVSVTCRREFGGSDGDPKFIDLVPTRRRGPPIVRRSRRRLRKREQTRWRNNPSSGRHCRTATGTMASRCGWRARVAASRRGGQPARLSSFGDFLDWPATVRNSTFVVTFGGASASIAGNDTTSANRIDTTLSALPDSPRGRALLPQPRSCAALPSRIVGRQVLSFRGQHRRPGADVMHDPRRIGKGPVAEGLGPAERRRMGKPDRQCRGQRPSIPEQRHRGAQSEAAVRHLC